MVFPVKDYIFWELELLKTIGFDLELSNFATKELLDDKIIYVVKSKNEKKIIKSLKRDQKILRYINGLYPGSVSKTFSFKVKISREKYVEMIKNRYISTLLNLSSADILKGINEISRKYNKRLNFRDKLICRILKK